MARFYMVAGEGPSYARHSNYEDAKEEAHRLARANPQLKYYVTEAVHEAYCLGDMMYQIEAQSAKNLSEVFEDPDNPKLPALFEDPNRKEKPGTRYFIIARDKYELDLVLWMYDPIKLTRRAPHEVPGELFNGGKLPGFFVMGTDWIEDLAPHNDESFRVRANRRRAYVRRELPPFAGRDMRDMMKFLD